MVEIRASIQNMVDKLSNMDTKFDKQNKKMVMENPLLAKNLDVIGSKKMWANTFDNFYPYYEEFIKINGEKIDLDSIDSVSMDFVNKMATGIDAIAGKYQKYKDYFEYTLNVSKIKQLLEDLLKGIGHAKLD